MRWFILAALLLAVFRAYQGWFSQQPFSRFDNFIRHATATTAHIQLTIGLALYFMSPIIEYFLLHYRNAVHQRDIRFFGMEHSIMMILAVIIITIGSARAKRKHQDNEKYKTMAIWYSIALIIILTSIPWAFSPFTSRPYFRAF